MRYKKIQHHYIICYNPPFSDFPDVIQNVHLVYESCHPQRFYTFSRLEVGHLSVKNFRVRAFAYPVID